MLGRRRPLFNHAGPHPSARSAQIALPTGPPDIPGGEPPRRTGTRTGYAEWRPTWRNTAPGGKQRGIGYRSGDRGSGIEKGGGGVRVGGRVWEDGWRTEATGSDPRPRFGLTWTAAPARSLADRASASGPGVQGR